MGVGISSANTTRPRLSWARELALALRIGAPTSIANASAVASTKDALLGVIENLQVRMEVSYHGAPGQFPDRLRHSTQLQLDLNGNVLAS